MKKGIFLFFVFVAVVLLSTACSSKSTLKCTMNSSGVDVNFNVAFNGNKIENMDFKYVMDLSSYSDVQIDAIGESDFCSKVKSSMDNFESAFDNCNQKLEDKKLNITANFDVNKISSSQLSKMQSPEDAKKDLENSGYSCTIEK